MSTALRDTRKACAPPFAPHPPASAQLPFAPMHCSTLTFVTPSIPCVRLTSFVAPMQVPPLRVAHRPAAITTFTTLPIRADSSDNPSTTTANPVLEKETVASPDDWKFQLCPGAVVEVWCNAQLRIAHVHSSYPRGVVAFFVDATSIPVSIGETPSKISFDEIISVWPTSLLPPDGLDNSSTTSLLAAVEHALNLLTTSAPRSLDLSSLYTSMRHPSKSRSPTTLSSAHIADSFFRSRPSDLPYHHAALTIATAFLVAADPIRFKRAAPGSGWRALPASVTLARGRCSFVDACHHILHHRSPQLNAPQPATVWNRDQLDILHDLEIAAASGSPAQGTAATALRALGYAPNDDGAATLLLDINYWTTGVSVPANLTPPRDPVIAHVHPQTFGGPQPENDEDGTSRSHAHNRDREWTFAPQLLAEARDIRTASRNRQRTYLTGELQHGRRRRSLLYPPPGHPTLRAYCIDDKAARFLDDAMSVQVLENGSIIRLWLHIADVDEIVTSGSALDEFAKERGQSLYLPLKPLHMLPGAAMDAASFCTSLPKEAISVMVEFDVKEDVVREWEVFPSVVPAVRRVSYEQFDVALEQGKEAAQLDDRTFEDLRAISFAAPLLVDKLDFRKVAQREREHRRTGGANGWSGRKGDTFEQKAIASVRLVKRWDRAGGKGVGGRVAQVVDFQNTGSHQTVRAVLTCGSSLIRQFARENRAFLPEMKDASIFVSRCGTAPLRRYGDLAIQRQVKCVLYGRQPAGRRRMEELRVWLAKRQAQGERTVAERRRSALFESLSAFCAQKCAVTGMEHAEIRGSVRGVSGSGRAGVKVDVVLEGTGLRASASVGEEVLKAIEEDGGSGRLLQSAKKVLKTNAKVRVEVIEVNTVAMTISARVSQVLK